MLTVVNFLLTYGLVWSVLNATVTGLDCYQCHTHSFPDCLQKQHTCHHGEACEFTVNQDGIKIVCRKTHECSHHDSNCGLLCDNAKCVSDHVDWIKGGSWDKSVLTAIKQTLSIDPGNILLNGSCGDELVGETCKNEQLVRCTNETGIRQCAKTCGLCSLIQTNFENGQCEDLLHCKLLTTNLCSISLYQGICPVTCGKCDDVLDRLVKQIVSLHSTSLSPTTPTTSMTTDTCVDTLDIPCSSLNNVCSNTLAPTMCRKYCGLCGQTHTLKSGGLISTTQQPTPITSTVTLQPRTTTTQSNPLLNGNCEDQLLNGDCSTQGSMHCETEAEIRSCAKTCGLCSLILHTFSGSGQCEDQLLNNNCELYKTSKDICNNTISRYTCPKTCNKCDHILDGLVKQVLSLHSTSLSPTTPTTSMTTDTCVDTLDIPCSSLNNVCSNTLAPTLCRKYCGLCGPPGSVTSTQQPAPTTSKGTLQHTALSTLSNPLLNGNCDDQLLNDGCLAQQSTQCKTKAGVWSCAKTCGLCSLIQNTFNRGGVCEDQLLHNNCELYKTSQNICNKTISKYTCPKTCGKCDDILGELVQQILSSGTRKSDPTAQTIPVASTVNACLDTLIGMSCSSLSGVCYNIAAPYVCRKYCGLCEFVELQREGAMQKIGIFECNVECVHVSP